MMMTNNSKFSNNPIINNPNDAFKVQRSLIDFDECVIFDVGAHYGETIDKYRKIFPCSNIYSFEPHSTSFDILSKKYNHDRKVHLENIAMSNIVGVTEFYINHMDATNSLFPRETKSRRYYPRHAVEKEILKVPVDTLDNYSRINDINKIDILKMDIQGSELLALQGAVQLLKTQQISLIYTEAFFISHYDGAPLYHAIAAYLERYDYTLFNMYSFKNGANGQLRFGNVIFVNSSLRESIINIFSPED